LSQISQQFILMKPKEQKSKFRFL